MKLHLQLSSNVRKTLGNLGSVFFRNKKRNLIRWPWNEWQDQFLCNHFTGSPPYVVLKWVYSASWLNNRRGNWEGVIKFTSNLSDSECVSSFRKLCLEQTLISPEHLCGSTWRLKDEVDGLFGPFWDSKQKKSEKLLRTRKSCVLTLPLHYYLCNLEQEYLWASFSSSIKKMIRQQLKDLLYLKFFEFDSIFTVL